MVVLCNLSLLLSDYQHWLGHRVTSSFFHNY